MAAVPVISEPALQALCDVLGSTERGLTGSQISRYLSECGIDDLEPGLAKRHRLFQALSHKQRQDLCANNVLRFITHVMSPVRYVGNREHFDVERERLNVILAFCGLKLTEAGALQHVETVSTISDAEARAGVLRKALVERRVHPDVLTFCRAELLVDDYFHAVFEATKSIAHKLRSLSGLSSDGSNLVDEALGIGKAGHPRIAFNSLSTDSERSEHTGMMNIIKGIFGAFRNTTAHAPRVHWVVSERDAIDILTMISLVHRRLDGSVRTHVQ